MRRSGRTGTAFCVGLMVCTVLLAIPQNEALKQSPGKSKTQLLRNMANATLPDNWVAKPFRNLQKLLTTVDQHLPATFFSAVDCPLDRSTLLFHDIRRIDEFGLNLVWVKWSTPSGDFCIQQLHPEPKETGFLSADQAARLLSISMGFRFVEAGIWEPDNIIAIISQLRIADPKIQDDEILQSLTPAIPLDWQDVQSALHVIPDPIGIERYISCKSAHEVPVNSAVHAAVRFGTTYIWEQHNFVQKNQNRHCINLIQPERAYLAKDQAAKFVHFLIDPEPVLAQLGNQQNEYRKYWQSMIKLSEFGAIESWNRNFVRQSKAPVHVCAETGTDCTPETKTHLFIPISQLSSAKRAQQLHRFYQDRDQTSPFNPETLWATLEYKNLSYPDPSLVEQKFASTSNAPLAKFDDTRAGQCSDSVLPNYSEFVPELLNQYTIRRKTVNCEDAVKGRENGYFCKYQSEKAYFADDPKFASTNRTSLADTQVVKALQQWRQQLHPQAVDRFWPVSLEQDRDGYFLRLQGCACSGKSRFVITDEKVSFLGPLWGESAVYPDEIALICH